MKKYLTKIKGTIIFYGRGSDYIYQPTQNSFFPTYEERNEEFILDTDFTPNDIYQLPNGYLVLRNCHGDEQPDSNLYILKNWSSELIEQDIDVKEDFEQLNEEFGGKYNLIKIPEELKALLSINHIYSIEFVKRKLFELLKDSEYLSGVGIGKENEKKFIMVYLTKSSKEIEKFIVMNSNSYPVRFKVTGEFKLHDNGNNI